MAKKAASKPKAVKTVKVAKPKAKAAPAKPITARLTYTAEIEVMTLINIMPGYKPDDVLAAINSKHADFYHEIEQIEVNGKVLATLKKPHLLADEYDDFEIEPI